MNCPNCGHEQTCPCKPCQDHFPTEKPWVWVDGEFIKCGNCGFTRSEGWWADYEYQMYKRGKGLVNDHN